MTQTRFVLTKALRQNLRPVVVINKVDRPTARIKEVENEILELFLDLEASDAQLDYPILYASAKEGWAMVEENGDQSHGMKPLIDLIIANVDAPK
jgi:GTP-binding protein